MRGLFNCGEGEKRSWRKKRFIFFLQTREVCWPKQSIVLQGIHTIMFPSGLTKLCRKCTALEDKMKRIRLSAVLVKKKTNVNFLRKQFAEYTAEKYTNISVTRFIVAQRELTQ